MDDLEKRRVVLVHDWLNGMRGGEKVLEVFCRKWPDAKLYTLIYQKGKLSEPIERLRPRTSFLQHFPGIFRWYRYTLPIMPWAVNWRLPECDLVLSSSHCVAKGVLPPEGVPHVCYCHTPMRYAWHMRQSYGWRGVKGWMVDRMLARLREWDRRTAANVTHFVANSKIVQDRIQQCYGRSSVVIYPPVDVHFYTPGTAPREDYYLILSAFAPYKRLDLAIDACNALGKRLVVIGSGQDEGKLRERAGPTIQFLGWQDGDVLREHLRRCQALLFPGEEDFGIVPVEAQACGTPVLAFGKGGATETVVPLGATDSPTGVWFEEQTPDALMDAIRRFEAAREAFDPAALRRHAETFRYERFEQEMFGYVGAVMNERKSSAA